MQAFVVQEGGVAAFQQVTIPKIGDNQVLVKTKAVALNSSDWKHIKYISKPGVLTGIEFAGEVVKVGRNLNPRFSWKVGDRVSGAVHGGTYTDRGAFADFVKADADLLWSIPDKLAYEQAVTMNVGPCSAVQALFHPERLGLVEPPQKVTEETWIFIYAGSTCVGQSAIQLASRAGYKIITVASPHNHQLVKSLGAEVVFDYRDPEVVSKIKKASGDSIRAAFDTLSKDDSQVLTSSIIAPGGGKVITLLPVCEAAADLRMDVVVQNTWLYSAFGVPWSLFGVKYPACPEDKLQISNFLATKLPQYVVDDQFRLPKINIWENGLVDIEKAIDYTIAGKVSAEKIVFKISNRA